MLYEKKEGVRGKWLEKTIDLNGKRAKLVSEVKPTESQFGMQDVAKLQVEGESESKNANINKPTIAALIDAFGQDSKNWVNKTLTIQCEKMVVSGKRVVALYLIPEGYELGEDAGGYVAITKVGGEKDAIEYPEGEANPSDIPF